MSRPLVLQMWEQDKVIRSSSHLGVPRASKPRPLLFLEHDILRNSASFQCQAPGWKNGGDLLTPERPTRPTAATPLACSLDHCGYVF